MIIGKLYFKEEAAIWQDATPIGNGTIGALIHNRITKEKIIFNHENLWLPVTKNRPLKNSSSYLSIVRDLAKQGKYSEIADYWYEKNAAYKDKGLYWPNPFQPACEMEINIKTVNPKNISRMLNLKNGESTLTWDSENEKYIRKGFVSRKDNLFIYKISSSNPINIDNIILKSVKTNGEKAWDNTPIDNLLQSKTQYRNNYIIYEGIYRNNVYGPSYGAIAKIITDGEISCSRKKMKIKNTKNTIIHLRIYDCKEWQEPIKNLIDSINSIQKNYDTLLKEHSIIHKNLFMNCRIDLFPEPELKNATCEELISKARDEGKPSRYLIQLMYEYGRYLLIASTGKLPANLQGVWNGSYNPPWQCDYTMDENIQMNYWQALQGNLQELMEPYYVLFNSQLPSWRQNARCIFNCQGVLAPIKSTVDALFHHINSEWSWHFWTAGAGWISSLYYEYYLFTNDLDFLSNTVFPLLYEIALFYMDYLEKDEEGKYTILIGISPENTPTGHNSLLSPNPTMEIAIIREVFSRLISSAKLLDLHTEMIPKWLDILNNLPKYMTNEDGALKEWLHKDYKDNYKHRHQSHIYPLFPAHEALKDDWLYEACKIAVEKRLDIGLDSQTGWSLMHMACIFSRLGWSNKAYECLTLETIGMVGPNLFTYHDKLYNYESNLRKKSSFQIDANFGMCAALQEMVLYSIPGFLSILPSIPSLWQKGLVNGMRARTCQHIDIEWDFIKGFIKIKIISEIDQNVLVKFPQVGQIETFGKHMRETQDINISLDKNKPIYLTFHYN